MRFSPRYPLRFSLPAIVLSAILTASLAQAADAQLKYSAAVAPKSIAPKSQAQLTVRIEIPPHWHLWSMDPGPGPKGLTFQVEDKASVVWQGPWRGPKAQAHFDTGFDRMLRRYEGGDTGQTLTFQRIFTHAAPSEGPQSHTLLLEGQLCSANTCISQKHPIPFSFVSDPTLPITKAPKTDIVHVLGQGSHMPSLNTTQKLQKQLGSKSDGLWAFLLLAFVAGLGALLTPCVFPAIPLTISFFSKFTTTSFAHTLKLAATYALTMVAVYTGAGVAAAALFGATGLQNFAAHPIFNIALGAVLFVFALNLLGLFELQTPMWLMGLANAFEAKLTGGQRKQAGSEKTQSLWQDMVAVAAAAITATTVFFTCTVAFVGVVLVAASQGNPLWPIAGMLAFASAFALPFFLLALFPAAAVRLRGRSGAWLHLVRACLGFIEMAAAIKFFSNADLVWQMGMISWQTALLAWLALTLGCAGVLLAIIPLAHTQDTRDGKKIDIGPIRMLVGLGALGLALLLATALIQKQPVGNWIDGWLPPRPLMHTQAQNASKGAFGKHNQSQAQGEASFEQYLNLRDARKAAKQSGKLVFVNYTGFTCTNCRFMESTVFYDPKVFSILSSMVHAELYTDGAKPAHKAMQRDQQDRFQTAALPFYSVETSSGDVLKTFAGASRTAQEFADFLSAAVAASQGSNSIQKKTLFEKEMTPNDAALPPLFALEPLKNHASIQALPAQRFTLIHLWATWCAPCREEFQEFLAAYGNRFIQAGGSFLTVAIEPQNNAQAAWDFAQSVGMPPATTLRADPMASWQPTLGFDGGSLPHAILLAPNNAVLWQHTGRIDAATLNAVLAKHQAPIPPPSAAQ